MRKWTYLVAALLMGGATATFTSCIDTDEPAGIEQLRGAKAALIQAKADYQAQLTAYREVQVRMAEVDLQLKEVTLQIEQLKVAKAQAQNEKDLADLQNQMEQLAETHKAKMLELQKETAVAQKDLNEALTNLEISLLVYRDNQYSAAINDAITAVQASRTRVNSLQDEILRYKSQLVAYEAQYGEAYRAGLVNDSLNLENAIDNLEFSLAQVESLREKDVAAEDWSEELAEIEKQIADINAQGTDIQKKIASINQAINPIEIKIKEIELGYTSPDYAVTIPVNKVPATIQADFITVLKSTSVNGNSWDSWASAPYVNEDGDAMVADYVSKVTSLKAPLGSSSNLDVEVDNLISALYAKYGADFATHYRTIFGTSISYTNGIASDYIKVAKTKVDEFAQDRKAEYDAFKADSSAWAVAYEAYKIAAKAYGFENTPYADTQAKLTAYWNESDATKKAAALTAARTALVSYYAVRVPLDNPTLPEVTPTGATEPVALNVALGNSTTYTDAMLGTLLDGYSLTYITNLLGDEIDLTNKTKTYTLGAEENDGALQKYLRTSNKAWGTSNTLASARVAAATEEDFEEGRAIGGSWGTYMTIESAYKSFSNIDSWVALTDYLQTLSDTYQSEIEAIAAQVREQNALIADQKDAKFKLEFDLAATIGYNSSNWSSDNPYTVPTVDKLDVLTLLRSDLTTAANNNANFSVYVFTVSNTTTGAGSWGLSTNTLDNLATTINGSIVDLVQSLDNKKAAISSYDQGLTSNALIQTIKEDIARAEVDLAEEQAKLERAEATLNNLLEAYAASAE